VCVVDTGVGQSGGGAGAGAGGQGYETGAGSRWGCGAVDGQTAREAASRQAGGGAGGGAWRVGGGGAGRVRGGVRAGCARSHKWVGRGVERGGCTKSDEARGLVRAWETAQPSFDDVEHGRRFKRNA
jgi:hypothetical protein